MCLDDKQQIGGMVKILPILVLFGASMGAVQAAEGSMGAVAPGESEGGITDRAFVVAPPKWSYAVERQRGSFLDCGEGMDLSQSDENGRGLTRLTCGVTSVSYTHLTLPTKA